MAARKPAADKPPVERKPRATPAKKGGAKPSAIRMAIDRRAVYVLAQARAELAAEERRTGKPGHLGYRPEFAPIARHQAAHGMTIDAIADLFGVARQTLKNWITAHPEMKTAIEDGRAVYDARVVAALGERCLGARLPMTKVFYDSKIGKVVKVKMTEHYPPDTEACKFWLTNRQPTEWKHKQDVQIGGIPGGEPLQSDVTLSPADVYMQMLRAGRDRMAAKGGGGA